MHTDLAKQRIAQRMRDLPGETQVPYGWAEFRRRRHRLPRVYGFAARHRLAAGITVLAVALGAAALAVSGHFSSAPREAARGSATMLAHAHRQPAAQLRARSLDRWLADLPPQPVVARVGARAAVSGLEGQIAELDDLMSAARAAGTRPVRLSGLERERSELVRSLAEVRYAEMLADQAAGSGTSRAMRLPTVKGEPQ